jgi:hypothetical protein
MFFMINNLMYSSGVEFTHACYSSKVPVGDVVPEKKKQHFVTEQDLKCYVVCAQFFVILFIIWDFGR